MAKLRLKRKDTTPTRQVTGTSYKATGPDAIKPPNYKELGSQQSSILPDVVPEVGTPYQAARTYTRMIRDDASVRISLRAGKAPVLGAEFFIDPFDDSDINLAIWEFVDFNIFHGMTTCWSKVLEQTLTMYENGKAVFEPVWEQREWAPKKTNSAANRKQYTMLRKLAYRPSSTLGKVEYDDNGGPVSIVQTAIGTDGKTREVVIPIEKLVIFTIEPQAGIEGMSLLRSAYKHWFYKDKLYAIDAIQKERHGIGVPDIEVSPAASPEDITAAHELGRNLRTNEYSYIVRPAALKVSFAEIKGNLVNALESADHHDNMIMKNIMVQFLNMGLSSSGGRATGATAMDMFLKSMRHIANSICEVLNLYVIPNLVAYNFDTDQFPQVKVRNLGEAKDLQMWSAAMRNLIEVGALTVDEQTEAWVRDQVDMPRLQTPWVPFEERPTRIQELLQGTATSQLAAKQAQQGNGVVPPGTPVTPPGKPSPSGGAGNVGKSPSSGAT
jgi:hypothetical protein